MNNFIFDFHTHAFPERIAEATMNHLSEIAGCRYYGSGTLSSLEDNLEEAGASSSLVLNIATNPLKNDKINTAAAETDYFVSGRVGKKKLLSFGSIHPDNPDALSECERVKALGLKGVKFHSDYQHFFADDEKLFPIYEKLAGLGLIAVFHGGPDPYSPDIIHCSAERAVTVLEKFPNLTVVLAHLGGNISEYQKSLELLAGKYENLYLDTSFCHGHIEPSLLREIIEKAGADHILFGSDYPWHTTKSEIELIRSLGLPEEDEAKILGLNAARLLGFDPEDLV